MRRPLPRRIRPLAHAAWRVVTAPADRWAIHALARAPHPDAARLAAALRAVRQPLPGPGQAAVAAIERERERLLGRDDLLVDGTLGEGMPYDATATVAEACAISKAPAAARLLYHLVAAFRPRSVVELGTNLGISAAYLAAALRANGDGGRLATLDASPYRLRVARELHARLKLRNVEYVHGRFVDTLEPVLRGTGPVDLAFVDGHHLYEPTLAYTGTILAHARPGALLVFDDIRWSGEMRRAWAALQADERFSLVVDAGMMGVCVCAEGTHERYRSPRMYSVVR